MLKLFRGKRVPQGLVDVSSLDSRYVVGMKQKPLFGIMGTNRKLGIR
jgi:hypothetical protein